MRSWFFHIPYQIWILESTTVSVVSIQRDRDSTQDKGGSCSQSYHTNQGQATVDEKLRCGLKNHVVAIPGSRQVASTYYREGRAAACLVLFFIYLHSCVETLTLQLDYFSRSPFRIISIWGGNNVSRKHFRQTTSTGTRKNLIIHWILIPTFR